MGVRLRIQNAWPRAAALAMAIVICAPPLGVARADPVAHRTAAADSPGDALQALMRQDFVNCANPRLSGEAQVKAAVNCRADGFAGAPDVKLAAVMRAKADYLRILLALSPSRCGKSLDRPDDRWPPDSPRVQAAGLKVLLAITDANVAGETAPVRRRPATADDWRVVLSGMVARGVSPSEAEASIAEHLDGIALADRCRVRLAQFESVANAPGPVAGRIVAMLARNMRYPE